MAERSAEHCAIAAVGYAGRFAACTVHSARPRIPVSSVALRPAARHAAGGAAARARARRAALQRPHEQALQLPADDASCVRSARCSAAGSNAHCRPMAPALDASAAELVAHDRRDRRVHASPPRLLPQPRPSALAPLSRPEFAVLHDGADSATHLTGARPMTPYARGVRAHSRWRSLQHPPRTRRPTPSSRKSATQIRQLKESYEARIQALEQRLKDAEAKSRERAPASRRRSTARARPRRRQPLPRRRHAASGISRVQSRDLGRAAGRLRQPVAGPGSICDRTASSRAETSRPAKRGFCHRRVGARRSPRTSTTRSSAT